MDSTGSSDDPGVKDELLSPGIRSRAYLKLGGMLMRRTCLWRDIRRFASWLESDAAQLADQARQGIIVVEPDPDQGGATARIGRAMHADVLKDYQLTRAYREVMTYAELIKADLNRAQVIQRKFLPDLTSGRLSEHVNWTFHFDPVEEVGGDYYDVQHLDDDRIAILFSDVSGHGMAAAFVTCILKTTFASWIESKIELSEFVDLLNSTLCSLTPVGNFAAVFVGIYSCSTGELCYVNGGHHPQPWRMPAANGDPISSITGGRTLLMGVDRDIEIEPSRLTLGAGDIVLFASDGVVENQDAEGELYGTDRFGDFLQAQRDGSVQNLIESIVKECRTFSTGAKQTDDRTLMALQIKDRATPPDPTNAQADQSNSSA
ncbi:MAG: PP2C family protein-serine/threonine phosphatase [Planctomycetota bacterium]|nr:PP2C family protein-serine/threonine phosphatase [Planctomycetota bacterium]